MRAGNAQYRLWRQKLSIDTRLLGKPAKVRATDIDSARLRIWLVPITETALATVSMVEENP